MTSSNPRGQRTLSAAAMVNRKPGWRIPGGPSGGPPGSSRSDLNRPPGDLLTSIISVTYDAHVALGACRMRRVVPHAERAAWTRYMLILKYVDIMFSNATIGSKGAAVATRMGRPDPSRGDAPRTRPNRRRITHRTRVRARKGRASLSCVPSPNGECAQVTHLQ
jgi:hypothetical protein